MKMKLNEPHPRGQIFGLLGRPSSGKTTLALTLPRPLLVLAAEKKSYTTLRNMAQGAVDIDVEEFIPLAVPLNSGVGTGDVNDPEAKGAAQACYQRFIDYLRKSVREADSALAQSATVMLDSGSSWASVFLDLSVDALGHRASGAQIGKQEVNDYSKAARTFVAVVRQLQVLGKHVVIPIHSSEIRDKDGNVKEIGLALPGGARSILPSILDHLFFLSRESVRDGLKFTMQTRSSGLVQQAFTSWPEMPLALDVTVADFKRPGEFGLGKLLKEFSGFNT